VAPSPRQFFLRPYIHQNLQHGASRNLVIRNVNANITAQLIRDHLEHIHNLVVLDVRVDYVQGHAHVHTNSVHNAMFARSCMKSRAAYRGMRIEFGGDECADDYPAEVQQERKRDRRDQKQKQKQKQGVALGSTANRFEMLRLEYESESESESESETDA
jgi:hypothetical protein